MNVGIGLAGEQGECSIGGTRYLAVQTDVRANYEGAKGRKEEWGWGWARIVRGGKLAKEAENRW